MDEEAFMQVAPHHCAKMSLQGATSILRRDEEIAAAKKKGRHHDADVQMKAFADTFEHLLISSLPPTPSEHRVRPPRLLGIDVKQSLSHQQAVRSAMRKDQADLRRSVEKPTEEHDIEAALAALKNLQQDEATATCVVVSLPEILKGPNT